MRGATRKYSSARIALRSIGYRSTAVTVAAVFLAGAAMPFTSLAAFKGCIANITPAEASVGTSTAFTVSITNGIGSDIQWVRATVPSANYVYQTSMVTGNWSVSDIGDGLLLAGGDSIGAGQTWAFQIVANTGVQNTAPEPWSVQVAPDPDGQDVRTCTGSLNTAITGQLPQDEVNGVSNIVVSDITTAAATISWDTDNPSTGLVYYGTSASYGSTTPLDNQYTVQHVVRLDGLTAGTTYRFQVVGTDDNGGYAYSIDNTFVTASAPPVPPGQTGGSFTPATPAIDPLPQVSAAAISADKQPPVIAVTTVLSGSYVAPPVITGTANDNVGVRTVDYSTDGGKNWLPADTLARSGNAVMYSFKPLVAADGNYQIVVRAVDVAGQVVVTAPQTLIIDRLPPLIGGSLLMIGSEAVRPSDAGVIDTVMGQELRIITSTVGGAVALTAEGVSVDQQKVAQSFSLAESADRTMWSGAVDFLHPGTYRMTIRSIDGAGNRDEKFIGLVRVAAAAQVIDAVSGQPLKATVGVYFRDPETDTWSVWDANQYDQSNPSVVGANGSYSLYLPSGTYYLKFRAPGYTEANTESFTLDRPTVVSTNVSMRKRPGLHVGRVGFSVPWVEPTLIRPNLSRPNTAAVPAADQNQIIGSQLPASLKLSLLDGAEVKQTQLLGKPTILTVVSTWAPPAQDQLAILNELDTKLLHVYAIGSGESPSKVAAYLRIAGYNVAALADAQNRLAATLQAPGLPTTYFLDRHGVVRHVITGVLSKDQLLQHAVD